MKPKISEKERNIIQSVGKKKFAWTFLKLFNKFCPACRQKAMQNPKRDWHEYCLACQNKITEAINKLQK